MYCSCLCWKLKPVLLGQFHKECQQFNHFDRLYSELIIKLNSHCVKLKQCLNSRRSIWQYGSRWTLMIWEILCHKRLWGHTQWSPIIIQYIISQRAVYRIREKTQCQQGTEGLTKFISPFFWKYDSSSHSSQCCRALKWFRSALPKPTLPFEN